MPRLAAPLLLLLLAACTHATAAAPATAVPCRGIDACAAACAADDARACTRLGRYAVTGDAELDPEAAIGPWLHACDLGDRAGCRLAGCQLERDGYPERAAALLAPADDCATVTAALEPWPDDAALRAACAAGEGLACQRAAEPIDDPALYRRACALAVASACLRAGDPAAALALYEPRCAAGSRAACEAIYNLTSSGVMMPPDPDRAAKARARLCALGEDDRC